MDRVYIIYEYVIIGVECSLYLEIRAKRREKVTRIPVSRSIEFDRNASMCTKGGKVVASIEAVMAVTVRRWIY